MIRNRRMIVLIILALLLSACQAAPGQTSSPTAAPTNLPSPTLASTATFLPVTPTATTQNLPAPSVLPYAWDDRSIFQANLIPSAQGILDQLPGASVYHIQVTIACDYQNLQGQEEVLYTNREGAPLKEIYFRLFPNLLGASMQVSDLLVDGQKAGFSLEQQSSAVHVPLVNPLQPGEQIVLQLNFSTPIPGAATNNYNIFSYANGVLAMADFYPVIPAYDQSGWHIEIPPSYGDQTYTDTSFYVVQVSAPSALKLATTGSILDTKKDGDTQTLTLAAGPVRDFYIAASEKYIPTTQTLGGTTVTSYAYSDDQTTGKQSLDVTQKAFKVYEQWFGVYPYTTFTIAETPTLALGVEYPQAIVITETLYHPSKDITETQRPTYFEATAAHEIAHQWFYGLVGDDQVNQPWLDESMAQYDTYLYYLGNYGQTAADNYKTNWAGRWQRVKDDPIPIGMPVADYNAGAYSAIIYGRGPMFFEALDQQMGTDKFAAFMKNYFEQYEYKIIDTSEFEQLAQKDCGCDLTSLFQKWIGN